MGFSGFAQQTPQNTPPFGLYVPQDHRPALFFREDFKAPPKGLQELPITQAYVENPNLELKLYGPGKELVFIDHHAGEPKDDPNFIWTGLTPGPWGLALKDKNNYVDLTGLGRIRWRTQQTGFHQVRPILKLANGTWIVGEYAEGWTPDWHESEFWPAEMRWRRLNADKMLEERMTTSPGENGAWEMNPDLSRSTRSASRTSWAAAATGRADGRASIGSKCTACPSSAKPSPKILPRPRWSRQTPQRRP